MSRQPRETPIRRLVAVGFPVSQKWLTLKS